MENIQKLADRFEEALAESNEYSAKIDSDVEDMIERNTYNQEILVIYEREVPELRKQIKDLNLLKSSLQTECNYSRKKKLRK